MRSTARKGGYRRAGLRGIGRMDGSKTKVRTREGRRERKIKKNDEEQQGAMGQREALKERECLKGKEMRDE